MLVMYSFFSLLAVHYHSHSEEYPLGKYAKHTQKSIDEVSEEDACMSCHIFQHASGEVWAEFSFSIMGNEQFWTLDTPFKIEVVRLAFRTIALRGPPFLG